MLELAWGGATHAGHVRARNEDAVLVAPPLFAVADGMGGHDAGQMASAMAVDVLGRVAERSTVTRSSVLEAVRAVNDELTALSVATGRTLGTTVCGLADLSAEGTDPTLVLFNVGDSRAYRLRRGSFVQLTRDHSLVQDLVDAGELRPVDARTHPDRNVITRSLGGEDYVTIDWWLLQPRRGDRYLLTSDGLTGELDDRAIRALLADIADPADAARRLVDSALQHGGRDNVSVVVVDVVATERRRALVPDPLEADTQPRRWRACEPDTAPMADLTLYAETTPLNDPCGP